MNYQTIREALYNTIHRNKKPLKVIAEETGMSENYLTRAALPDDEESSTGTGCRFPLKKIVPLTLSTNDYSVLDAIEHAVNRIGIPLLPSGKMPAADVLRLTIKAVGEFGDLMREIESALADNKITPAEHARIKKEGYHAAQAILTLVSACEDKQ